MHKRFGRVLTVMLLVLLGVVACGQGAENDDRVHVIAGGDTSGVYFNYAAQLAAALTKELDVTVEAVQSQGSVDNLQRVGTGEATFGFAQGDAAADAVNGGGKFEQPLAIRAVARVYDEYVHVVVPASSDVHHLADLPGRTVSLGASGSGVQVIATRLLEASGVAPESVHDVELGLEDSIDALQSGRIEAFFWVGGLPTPGIERLQKAVPIRLLSIDADVVATVNSGHAGVYQLADFPVELYEVSTPAVTMIVPNYLVTRAEVSDELVYSTLSVLFDARALIAQEVPAANYLDRRQAIFTEPIQLHPGAARYFVEYRR